MRIFVGNLSFETTTSQINELFSQHGEVHEVALIADRNTGRSRGFGFVEMRNDQAARQAIGSLDGTDLDGRHINVAEAKSRDDQQTAKRNSW